MIEEPPEGAPRLSFLAAGTSRCWSSIKSGGQNRCNTLISKVHGRGCLSALRERTSCPAPESFSLSNFQPHLTLSLPSALGAWPFRTPLSPLGSIARAKLRGHGLVDPLNMVPREITLRTLSGFMSILEVPRAQPVSRTSAASKDQREVGENSPVRQRATRRNGWHAPEGCGQKRGRAVVSITAFRRHGVELGYQH